MIENVHLSRLIDVQACKQGRRIAIMYRDANVGFWHEVAWNMLAQTVQRAANSFLSLGIRPQQKIMVYAENMPECIYASFGAYKVRAITIPVFATLNVARLKYITDEAEISYIFVGEQKQYDTAFALYALCPSLVKLIICDRNVVRKPIDRTSIYFQDFLDFGANDDNAVEMQTRENDANFDDIADIIYTSGTTGESKGVTLTYRMYSEAIRSNHQFVTIGPDDTTLSFLPLSHIFERAWTFFVMANGAKVALNLHPRFIRRSVFEIRPTAMCVVPHFWEKVYEIFTDKIEKSSPQQREILKDALKTGHERNIVYNGLKENVPPEIEEKYQRYEKTVFNEFRILLGLERARLIPTAGAIIPVELEDFVRSCGFGMIIGYGLTESTATVSCDDISKPRTLGSVGRLIDSLEIRFSKENEILLKGSTITKGYYRRTDSTTSSFINGWFKTGDSGYIKDGELFLTGRLKDLFKTSNGKYIAQQMLEAKFSMDLFINQILIIAEQRKFVSALIVPDYIRLEEYAYRHKIKYQTRKELCENEQIHEMMNERIDLLQQELADYEKVKKFILLDRPFSMEKGELTTTLKICRNVINEHYAGEIEKIYSCSKPDNH